MYEIFARLLQEKGLKAADVSRATGIKSPVFSEWKKGKSKPNTEKMIKIANFLGVTVNYLMAGEERALPNLSNVYPIKLKKFPFLEKVDCGEPEFTAKDDENYVMAGTDIKADFCLKAKGDSMINAHIFDGDIVFIRKQDIVENGEIAAVVMNNGSEVILKRFYYYREKAFLILKPENPLYKDQIYQGEELNQVHILGKAVSFQSDVR